MPRPSDVGTYGEALYAKLEPLAYDDEANDWALLILCGAIGQMYQQLHDLTSESEDGRPGWADLMDVEACPYDYLHFLGYLVGIVIPKGSDETTARDYVRTPSGFKRGITAAIEAAAARTLTGTKTVTIIERDEDPYNLTVITEPSETPDDDATYAAILAQKPAGLILNHYVVDDTIIDELEGIISDLGGTIDEL